MTTAGNDELLTPGECAVFWRVDHRTLAVQLHGRVAAGRVALIDAADQELVAGFRWTVHERKRPGRLSLSGPYAIAKFGPVSRRGAIQMHNLIMGIRRVDHANHDGLDNRRSNLRPVDGRLNMANSQKRPGTSSRFKGVCWYKARREWSASIGIGRKRVFLGYFATEEDAARAYDAAALAAWGEYAFCNLPQAVGEGS